MDLTKNVNEIITDMAAAIDNLKEQILQAVYPLGSVYVSITDSRNPTDILGFGTWEAMPAGYGLVAQGTATAEDGSTLTFTAGQKSGEFKHQITVGESARHSHADIAVYGTQSSSNTNHRQTYKHDIVDESASFVLTGLDCMPTGGNQYHNNVSPCISAYMFKRVD